jgi:hypothetical protein
MPYPDAMKRDSEKKYIYHYSSDTFIDLAGFISLGGFEYKKLVDFNDFFKELQHNNCVLLVIELSEVSREHLNLLSQFNERCVFIFDDIVDLQESIELLSKFNIFTFFKDINLNEKLVDLFVSLGITENESQRLEVTNLSIQTDSKVLIHADELTSGALRVKKPGVLDYVPFVNVQLSLKYFAFVETFEPSQLKLESEELIFNTDFSEIYERIDTINIKNNPNIVCAYITSEPVQFQIFSELGVKVNIYKSLKDFSGDENFIVIRDKLVDVNETVGKSFCELDYADKSVLITNRILNEREYPIETLKSTTENINSQLLNDFISENTISSSGEKFTFDSRSNISFGELRMPARLVGMSENQLKVIIPFKLVTSSRIVLSFFGRETFTVLESETVSEGFLHTVQVDHFSEIRMNKFRVQLNQLIYCQDNEISLLELRTINELDSIEMDLVDDL